MGTATVFRHQWVEKDHARGKLPPRPRPPAAPKSTDVPAPPAIKNKQTGDASITATEAINNIGSPHFLIENRNIAVQHCIDRRHRPTAARDLVENTPITVPVRSVNEHAMYQLCFADDHAHQHTFKIKVRYIFIPLLVFLS